MTFSAGFRFGLGLWLARLLLYIVAIPLGGCLLYAAITVIDLILDLLWRLLCL